MTTEKQLQANRANAQKSTGPISPAGKAISRQNALSHGLTAEVLLLEGEYEFDYAALLTEFELEFAPEGRLEVEYVARLANLAWRLRRIPAFEVALFGWLGAHRDMTEFHKSARPTMRLGLALRAAMDNTLVDKLSRYEVHLTRQYKETLEQLEKTKALRLTRAGNHHLITIDNDPAPGLAGEGPAAAD